MAGGNAVARLLIDVAFDGAQAAGQADSLASKFSNMAKTIIASALGIGGALGAAGLLKSAITAASSLEQSMGGVDAVFKDSASQIHDWASNTSDSFRLPQAEAEQYATVVGAQLKNAGFAMRDLAPETQKLITLGGDLASTFGGPTSDAVQALGAALRGETDPIERYGVSMNQAAVEAKALAIAQETGADAADKATIMQARLALIYEQTADAQGQAARESQTFAAAQEELSGAFNTLLLALGGPILQAAADFLGFLADVLKGIEPVIAAIGSLLGWFTQLPGPVQAAGLALAALAVFMGPALLTVFKAFVLLIPALITGMGGAAGAAGRLGPALAALAARFTSVGTAARGFGLAMLGIGGGWALAIAAAVALATYALMAWIDSNRRAEEAMQETAAAADSFFEILKEGQDDLEGVTSGKALRLKAFDLMTDAFKDTGLSVRQTADLINETLGTDVPQAMQTMITGLASNGREGQQVIDAFNTRIAALRAEATKPIGARGTMVDTGINDEQIAQLEKLRDKYTNMTPAVEAARDRLDAYNSVVGETPEDQKTRSVEELEGALKAAQGAAKLNFEMGAGAQLLNEAAQAASAAARSIDIYQASIDKATGNNRAYQDSQAAFNATILDLPETFKKAGEGVGFNTQAFKEWNTQLLTTSEGGQAVYKSVSDMALAANDATVRAYENAKATHTQADAIGIAKEQANNSYEQFINMAGAMGLSSEEAASLAGEIGLLSKEQVEDKIFEIIAEDQAAAITMKLWETVKLDPVTKQFYAEVPAAQTLADQMNAEINKTNPNPIPVTPEVGAPTTTSTAPAAAAAATGAAQTAPSVTVGTTVTPAPVAPGPVGAAATTGAAQTGGQVTVGVEAPAIPDISSGLADIAASNVTVIITADTTQAWSAVQLFKTASVVPATVIIKADANQANATLRAVIGGVYSTTVQIKGDSVPVNNTIRAVIGGSYSTTVDINGDNSGAISAIRAITTGVYTATVRIVANADGFWSVWNSLPTSRTITVTVNQVQGAVVAPPAAPGGLRTANFAAPMAAFQAPAVTAVGPVGTSSGSSGNVNITIQAGVGDPDAIARAVKRVILGRDRRSGGVVVGEMRSRVGHS